MAGSRNKVVTAIVGGRDKIRDDQKTGDYDFVAFTDQESKLWEVRRPYKKFKEGVMNAKIHKVLIHKFVDADVSLWMDGNMALQADLNKLVDEWLGDYDLAVFPHPRRNCVYQEIEACIGFEKADTEELNIQWDKYDKEGYPKNNGLGQCNILLRRHNERTAKFNERWWAEICSQSPRDQVSFPYVASKCDLKMKYLRGKGFVEHHPYFHYDRTHHHSDRWRR